LKDVHTLPGVDIDSGYNYLVVKIYTGLKKITNFQKGKPRWVLEELYAQ
jgi:hypothetical protein